MRANIRNNDSSGSRTGRRGSDRNRQGNHAGHRQTSSTTFRNLRNNNRERNLRNLATHSNRPTNRYVNWPSEIQRRNTPRDVPRHSHSLPNNAATRNRDGTTRAEAQLPSFHSRPLLHSIIPSITRPLNLGVMTQHGMYNHIFEDGSMGLNAGILPRPFRETLTKAEVKALPVMIFGEDGKSLMNVIQRYEEHNPVEEEAWYIRHDYDDDNGNTGGNVNNGSNTMPRLEMSYLETGHWFPAEAEHSNGDDGINLGDDGDNHNHSDTNESLDDDFNPPERRRPQSSVSILANYEYESLGQNPNEAEDDEVIVPVPVPNPILVRNYSDANLGTLSFNEIDEEGDSNANGNTPSLSDVNSDPDSDTSVDTIFLTNADIPGFDSDSSDSDSNSMPELHLRQVDSNSDSDMNQNVLASSSSEDNIGAIQELIVPKEVTEESSIKAEERNKLKEEAIRKKKQLIQAAFDTCTMCSICICNHEKGEELRLLPDCGHAFHTECIMPWLTQKKNSCPLCLTKVRKRSVSTVTGDTSNRQMDENESTEAADSVSGMATLERRELESTLLILSTMLVLERTLSLDSPL